MEALQLENENLKKQVLEGKSKSDEIENKYNDLIAELKVLKEKSTSASPGAPADCDDPLSSLLASATEAAAGLRDLQNHWSQLNVATKGNSLKIEQILQYGMLNSLLLHGLLDIPDIHGYEFGFWIVNKLNELLLQHLAFKIDLSHVEYAHVLPTKSNKKSVVIVKFSSRFARNDVYDNRSKLRGSGISITEHLTKNNLNLLKDARAIVGFRNVWTSQTKILANLEGEVVRVQSTEDLDGLKQKVAVAFPSGLPDEYQAPRKNGEKRKSRPSAGGRPGFDRSKSSFQSRYAPNNVINNAPPNTAWVTQSQYPQSQYPENQNNLNFRNNTNNAYSQSSLSQPPLINYGSSQGVAGGYRPG